MSFKAITREKIVSWQLENLKAILSFISILIFIAVAILTWNWQKKQQEYKAQVALYKFKLSLKDLTKEDEDNKNFNFLKKEEDKKLVLTQDMEKLASSYEQVIKEQKKFQTAVASAIDLADFYYRYGKKEQAKKLLSLFAFPLKKHSLYHLAVFQLVSYYMNEKDCEKALPLLSKLISNKKAKAFYMESRLQKALCLEAEGKSKLALEEYEKLNIENSDNYLGRLAKDYKSLLILKEKLKK